jgi:hypothetical protein
MAFNIKNAISKAAKGVDMNVAQKGGGTYTPPATGVPGLRFVAYVELGPQNETYQGQERVREQVKLVFELHGKKWPLSDNGQPQRITVSLAKSLNEKATFYKLFKAMNYDGKAKHFAELLGQDYVGTVYHSVWKSDPNKVTATFKDPNTGVINIRPPFVEDEEGEAQRRNVPPAISELRLFLWDAPDADQWASIFIDGEYEPGKSKNVFQNAIKASPAFEGSPIEALLLGATDDDDADDVEKAKAEAKAKKAEKAAAPKKTTKAAEKKPEPAPASDDGGEDDPLAGVGEDDIPF